jgi:hypothetical protein
MDLEADQGGLARNELAAPWKSSAALRHSELPGLPEASSRQSGP